MTGKHVRIQLLILVLALGGLGASQAGWQDLLKSAQDAVGSTGMSAGSNALGAGLSDGEIGDGLKEALSIGAERAVALLAQSGGFLNDNSVRIPLPGALKTVGRTLRAVGQGRYVDDFETTVNLAAEAAIGQTLDIVKDTVRGMTLQDVRGILTGPDDSATQFLRSNAGERMAAAVLPIVTQATEQAGVTAAYKGLVDQAGGMAGGFLSTSALDVDQYVTEKTLDGLFLKLAAEEKNIRENPLARSTDLLKQVFAR